MSAPAEVLAVVAEWIAKAENDLKAATYTLRMQSDCPTDTVCFHAQQCVEKYLKSLLVLRSTPFPRTHDLAVISRLLPDAWRPDLSPEQMRRFTDYGTVTRYPGEYEPIALAEARASIAVARRVRKHVRALLPAGVLRRRR